MVRIKTGNQFDRSGLRMRLNVPVGSKTEVETGDQHGDSTAEIDLVEREVEQLKAELDRLRALIAAASPPATDAQAMLQSEAAAFADRAAGAAGSRKWYSISAKGLLAAANLVGASVSPIAASALKVIDLLDKIRAHV